MNYLSTEKRTAVLRCLTEGCSLRATARMTDVAKDTVVRVLVQAGQVCSDYQDRALHNLPCRKLQADEIWSFVYAKRKNLPYAIALPEHAGDTWTWWIAMCADTKLIPTWRVGARTLRAAQDFMDDLKPRLMHRVQLTTDGHSAYLEAVEGAFGNGIDYAQLIKVYGGKVDDDGQPVSTKYTMHYNFCRIHSSLRVTPAMAAGVTESVWELEDVAQMVEDATKTHGPRGPYRKKSPADKRRETYVSRYERIDRYRERVGLPLMDWDAELDKRIQEAKKRQKFRFEREL